MGWLSRIAGVLAVVAITLAIAAPARASLGATATLAPIGTGSYLLTLTNTGSTTFEIFGVEAGESPMPTNIVPNTCRFGIPLAGVVGCTAPVAPGAMTQMCYTGAAAAGVELSGYPVTVSTSAAVASCPLPGFNAGAGSAPGSATTPSASGKGTKAWTHAQCKSTYKAWRKGYRHATARQKKAEANALHKTRGCPLSILN